MARAKVNIRGLRKAWDGHERHPLVDQLDRFLLDKGYASLGFEGEGFGYEWERPLFPGYRERIWVHPDYPKGRQGIFGFTVSLFTMSLRQAQVERALDFEAKLRRLDTCMQNYRQASDVCVLVTHMGWLRYAWPPCAPWPPPSNSLDWITMPTNRSAEALAEVIACWEHQYQDYLRMIDTPRKLAQVIANYRTLPGNERGDGPGSANPAVYAAVLLHDSGHSNEALAELEAERRVLAADAYRDPLRQLPLSAHLCRQAELTRWIKGEIEIPWPSDQDQIVGSR